MGERGNALLRLADRYAGIPLTLPAAAFRLLDRKFQYWRHAVHGDARDIAGKAGCRVGIFCPGALGDAILLSALITGIRRQAPHAAIEFIGSAANAAVLPLLPHLQTASAFAIGDVASIIRHVRRRKYGIFIDASQWARIGSIVTALSGAAMTAGFVTSGQWRSLPYDLRAEHRTDRHELENFLSLGRVIWPELHGRPQLQISSTKAGTDNACVSKYGKTIFCHFWPAPGAGRYLKQWPETHWARLIEALTAKGYNVSLTGSAEDAPGCEAFKRKYFPCLSRVHIAAGRESLAALAAAMSCCAAVVSVNTGIMHLAAAAGARTVGLHGATDPARWGPAGDNAVSLLPSQGQRAYLNLGHEYPPGVQPAMEHLGVGAVLAALERLGAI